MTVPTSHVVGEKQPALLQTTEHDLCPGCGEPVALRILLETIAELGLATSTVAVVGIGCYTAFSGTIDLDLVQALHGRAPSVATGVKRMRPDRTVLTLQGDGDMVNEGLQEVLHTAARGESITCVLLNNGVFGETGGHMTATSAPRPASRAATPATTATRSSSATCSPGSTAPPTSPGARCTAPGPWPAPSACCGGRSSPSSGARASRSSRSSPCARRAGSSPPPRGRRTWTTPWARST